MSHELAIVEGKVSMAYAGEAPWHGLGQQLNAPMTAAEAISEAGLGYQVELKALTTIDGVPVPKRRAAVRTDTGSVLGTVGTFYVPIQNSAAFDFLDQIVADGGLRYETAGALGQGERVWLLAKLPGQIQVKGSDDVTEKFLLLSNSHDGSAALRVFITPIRVVCHNTLTLARRQGRHQGISIFHKGNLQTKVQEAQKVLGLAHRFYEECELKIDRLAHHYPTVAQLDYLFSSLFPDPLHFPERSRAGCVRQDLFYLFEEGRGQDLPEIRHTAWAALNAVTEYVDHHRQTRATTDAERRSRRLKSQWFGSGAQLKAKAWELALKIAT